MSRNYQRQLALLDTPAGDLRAFKKEGGKIRLYDMGGSPSTPEKTTTTVELPEWARGYAKDTLAKGSALTDISKNPYQQYGGERIAGFQPLQQRTFDTAAQMQPSQQVGLGSSIAGAAGLGALNTNYQGGRFYGGQFNDQAVQDYMDPYAKNVVDYQKAQALRDFQIAQPMRQAQAVQQGAFGGSRSAIIDAEAQRSLNSQLQGIEATGRQAAFQNAQQQFERDQARRLQAQGMGEQSRQYGAGLGMQGLQTGLQAAGQLGQLGQNEYGQRMGITQLQSQLGTQQQQQAQRPLDMAYQDFLNQQNYPYKQLGFMSDMIRGLPLGQQSTQSVYEGSGNAMSQLAGIGMGAYGLSRAGVFDSKGNAEGGLMGYAVGGVTSDQNVESIIGDLSDQQLQQAKEAALNRRDVEQAQMIDAEMAERASIRGGLGGAFNQLPLEQQEQMMAGGGIVAFAGGGSYLDQVKENQQQQLGLIDQAVTQPSIAEQKTNILGQREMLNSLYPESVLPKYLEETKAERTKLSGQLERDSGFAMVLAAADLLEGASLPKAAAKAARTYIGEVNRLKSENKKADSLLRQSEIQLATAAQLQEEGRTNMAITKAEKGQELEAKGAELRAGVYGKFAEMANELAKTEMAGDVQIRATQITAAAGERNAKLAARKPSTQMEGVAIKAAEIKRRFPDRPDAQVMDEALEEYLSQSGKYPSTDRAADARATFYEKISSNVDERLVMDKKYRALQKEDKKTGGTAADQYREQLIAIEMDKARSQNQPAPGATQPAPNAQQQPAPVAKPSLDEFLPAARKANQGVSDADLIKYYNDKYNK
jgi:hypothetical protein